MNAFRKSTSTVLLVILIITLAACGSSPTPDPGGPGEPGGPDDPSASIRITPSDPTMDVSETLTFTAVVNGGEGPQAVSWSSADETIITIDSAGMATALAPGTTHVTATSAVDTSLTGSAEVFVPEPRCLAPTEISSDIIADRTLSRRAHALSCTDYVVTDWLDVYRSLVIEPGVTVDFAWGAGLFVTGVPGGSLNAVGQLTEPIRFRSAAGATGPWRGLVFGSNSPDNQLAHVIIEGAGAPVSDAITPFDIRALVIVPIGYSVTITDTLFRDAEAYGVWLGRDAQLTAFSGNSFQSLDFAPVTLGLGQVGQLGTDNSYASADRPNGLELIELQQRPQLTSDVTVQDFGVPYRLLGLQAVTGANLTLEPGVTLQFAEDAGLIIEDTPTETGSFKAVGTTDKQIVLTAADDPATAQYWDGLVITADGASEIRHATIGYGGGNTDVRSPPNRGGNIVLTDGARLTISDTLLHDAPACLETLGSTVNLTIDAATISARNCDL